MIEQHTSDIIELGNAKTQTQQWVAGPYPDAMLSPPRGKLPEAPIGETH